MNIRELARLLELQHDRQLSAQQIEALRGELEANAAAAAWWRHASALDQQLAQALQSRLDGASLPPARREHMWARVQSHASRPALLRAAPVLLTISIVVCILSVARIWSGTISGTQPPAQEQELAPTLSVLTPSPTPYPTPTLVEIGM